MRRNDRASLGPGEVTVTLPDPLVSLEAWVSQELEELTAAVRARAVQIRADGARRARGVQRQTVGAARRQAMTEAGIMMDEAAARERRRRDAVVREKLDALYRAVTTDLLDAAGSPWGDVATVALMNAALESLPTANRVHVHPAHVEAARQVLSDRLVAAEICADLDELGAVVCDDVGRRVVKTVSERLRVLWPTACAEIAADWQRPPRNRHRLGGHGEPDPPDHP